MENLLSNDLRDRLMDEVDGCSVQWPVIRSSYAATLVAEQVLSVIPEPDIIDVQIGCEARERKAATLKRLRHALKRIKDKGYYAATLDELIEKGREADRAASLMYLLTYVECALHFQRRAGEVEIPDDVWYMAIECAMAERRFNLFADRDAMFGACIDEDIDAIYSYVYLIMYLVEGRSMNQELIDELCELEDLREAEEEAEPAPIQEQPAQEDVLAIEALLRRTQDLKEALEAEKRAYKKKIRGLEHDLKCAQEAADEEIQLLREQNAQLMEYILRGGQEEESEEEVAPAAPVEAEHREYAYPLPESRVLFLGGHRNMVKKVQERHPGWTFITDDIARGMNVDFKAIFFWTKHCSHPLRWRVFAAFEDIPPVIYVTATNIERLEQEMLAGYNKLRE